MHFFLLFLTKEADILRATIFQWGGIFLRMTHKQKWMGSTYYFFFKDFQELQKVDKTVSPSFMISQFVSYGSDDVHMVCDGDSSFSITTS